MPTQASSTNPSYGAQVDPTHNYLAGAQAIITGAIAGLAGPARRKPSVARILFNWDDFFAWAGGNTFSRSREVRKLARSYVENTPALDRLRERVKATGPPPSSPQEAAERAFKALDSAAREDPEALAALAYELAPDSEGRGLFLRQLGKTLLSPETTGLLKGERRGERSAPFGTEGPLGRIPVLQRLAGLLGVTPGLFPTAPQTPPLQQRPPTPYPLTPDARPWYSTPTPQQGGAMSMIGDWASALSGLATTAVNAYATIRAADGGGGSMLPALVGYGAGQLAAPVNYPQVYVPPGSQSLPEQVWNYMTDLPGVDIAPQGSVNQLTALQSPYSRTRAGNAIAKPFVLSNPVSGALMWFGPYGKPKGWTKVTVKKQRGCSRKGR